MHRFALIVPAVLLLAACGGSGAAAPASAPASTAAAAKPSTAAPASASAKPAAAASGSAAAAPASGSAAAAPAGQMRKAKLAWATLTPLFLPTHVGLAAGIYQKHNIDLELSYTNNGPATMAALTGGDVQFAELADPSVTTSALQGLGVEWIAVSVPKPNLVLWAKPNINSMQDLKGKKIGVTTLGSVTGLFALAAIKQAGLEPQKDISVIAAGGPAEQRAALAAGAIDAAVGDPDGPYEGVKVLVDLRQGFDFPQAGIAVTKAFAQKDPQLAQDFVTAFVESIRRYKSDPELTVKVDMQYLKNTEAAAKKEVDGAIKIMNDDVAPNEKLIQQVLNMISDTNSKAKSANPKDFYDDTFAKAAAQQAAK